LSFSQPVIRSPFACELTRLPRPSSVKSTSEYHAADEVPGDRGHVGRQREAVERRAIDLVDALVDRVVARRPHVGPGAVRGEAVAREVLGRGEDAVGVLEVPRAALEAVDGRLHLRDEARILAEGLVRAAPAVVARHADARREGPLRPGGPRLLGGDMLDVAHEVRVARGAEADVVREDRRAVHVAVAVHGVDAVEDRDVQAGGERGALVAVDHVRPRGRGVRGRHRPAAGQDAAQVVVGDLRRVGVDVRPLGLRHLADLLGQRHLGEPLVGDRVERRQRQRRLRS